MQPGVFLLVGFPGVGKYTVGQALVAELEARGEPTKLIDNHYVNNPIFGVIKTDGVTPIPPGAWALVGQVRAAVLTAIEEHSPAEMSFVFTNFIHSEEAASDPGVRRYLDRLEAIAQQRGTTLRVVRLECDEVENCRRIVNQGRATRLKTTSSEWLTAMRNEHTIYEPADRAALTLDITDMEPAEAVRRILAHDWPAASQDQPA